MSTHPTSGTTHHGATGGGRLRRTGSTLLGLTTALALGAGGLVSTAPAAQAAVENVSGVQFRWGFNNESNNRGAAPGTFNFFSAGKLGNPGEGGQALANASEGSTWANGRAAGWRANDGDVSIEKLQPDGTYAAATWAGTKTDKDGVSLGPYSTSTKFSDHQVVIDDGTGTLDADADDADISWDGDFTVIYYSGYTFFYVSDPHLVVEDGVGTVTATLSGYGSDMQDMTQWNTLPETEVTLATLPDVDVTATGLVTTPAYAGVTYEAPADATAQVRTGPHWGSFPQSFVDFQQATGQGAYWYSSGGGVDKNKHALPLTVTTKPVDHVDPTEPVVKTTPAIAVSSSRSTYGRSAVVTVRVTPRSGSAGAATGSLTLSGAGAAQTRRLSGGAARFTLPTTLKPGTRTLTASYGGDTHYHPATGTRAHTVVKAGVARPTVKITKRPTSKKTGRAVIAVRSAVPRATVSGKARITLTLPSKGKGKKKTKKVTRRIAATVRNGKAAISLPRLKKGTWKVSIAYAGSATHHQRTSKTSTLKIRK